MNRLKCTPGIIALVTSAAVFALRVVDTQGVEFTEQKARPAATDSPSDSSSTKTLLDRAKRGSLQDVLQNVRGDTGKWSDEPRLQHAPLIQEKPAKVLLDV